LADPRKNTGVEPALAYLVDKPLVNAPGAAFAYSTFGFNLLGVVLEKASHRSFDDLLEARINAKAGAHIAVDHETRPVTRRAVGYALEGGNVERREETADVGWKAPGGGLISTVRDFARDCAALDGDALVTPTDKALLWTEQKDASGHGTKYGFGFGVGRVLGERHVGHTGAQEKTRTALSFFPDRHLCVVVMTNAEYADVDGIGDALDRAALASAVPFG
jgi:CubicO group peptidase (beta-lactamase class C family)